MYAVTQHTIRDEQIVQGFESVIEMVKQKRRQSIGFSYTAGETPSHQAGDDIDDSKRGGGGGEEEDEERSSNGTDMFRCSCNAGKIEEELLLLRKATTHALSKTWDDIEELRQGTSMKMAEIETLEDIITDVETEQVYITGQIQRKSKEIERKGSERVLLSAIFFLCLFVAIL